MQRVGRGRQPHSRGMLRERRAREAKPARCSRAPRRVGASLRSSLSRKFRSRARHCKSGWQFIPHPILFREVDSAGRVRRQRCRGSVTNLQP